MLPLLTNREKTMNLDIDRVADEIIDKIIAERPQWEVDRAKRSAEILEQELEDIARKIEIHNEINIYELSAIREAMRTHKIEPNIALTLAYRLGLQTDR